MDGHSNVPTCMAPMPYPEAVSYLHGGRLFDGSTLVCGGHKYVYLFLPTNARTCAYNILQPSPQTATPTLCPPRSASGTTSTPTPGSAPPTCPTSPAMAPHSRPALTTVSSFLEDKVFIYALKKRAPSDYNERADRATSTMKKDVVYTRDGETFFELPDMTLARFGRPNSRVSRSCGHALSPTEISTVSPLWERPCWRSAASLAPRAVAAICGNTTWILRCGEILR